MQASHTLSNIRDLCGIAERYNALVEESISTGQDARNRTLMWLAAALLSADIYMLFEHSGGASASTWGFAVSSFLSVASLIWCVEIFRRGTFIVPFMKLDEYAKYFIRKDESEAICDEAKILAVIECYVGFLENYQQVLDSMTRQIARRARCFDAVGVMLCCGMSVSFASAMLELFS